MLERGGRICICLFLLVQLSGQFMCSPHPDLTVGPGILPPGRVGYLIEQVLPALKDGNRFIGLRTGINLKDVLL